MATPLDVVTGAFSYTGKYITQRLLAANRQVRTLTHHPDRPHSFKEGIVAMPYHFEKPDLLAKQLEGADTLYNTYWIRFPFAGLSFEQAIANSQILFQAAKKAGVRRIVHVSIANPSKESPLPYYSGKARVEEALLAAGISQAIFRPTVIFGREDILINNIAYLIRCFPVLGVPGDGRYKIQPIYVEDLADAMVAAGRLSENQIRDAAGPETFAYNDLLAQIAHTLGKPSRKIHLPPAMIYGSSFVLGKFLGDVLLTREEITGLMTNLLCSNQPPLGRMRLTEWLHENRETVGKRYANEVKRHF